ncbi:MAG: bifunctional diguanylate cyclase/phosphodiesterase [Erythrobacter sp.]|uniref:putative bifunctional diguanylate cyclase/phosphodiesterase n=1 Tax=Erythrobacter sp. TaxID=1042 RepID=UPI0026050499|nr:bifunctional diguanylate cyclase/phosphodiesterase [Erythrobacter sp.]MDJ0978973.1 bifunctional diguanylate cyclase/phosphodiesterase [Erythrobacter sp.]
MIDKSKPLRLTPLGLVGVPLATITFALALIALVVMASDQVEFRSPSSLLIASALVYAATIFFLGRSGIANVRELESLTVTDQLSRLPNRRLLHEDIDALSNGGEEVAIALIDLDSFKQVNDHYGHTVGDQLIKACADALREACGAEARCYRLGGDEFAAVMGGAAAGTILEGICRGLLERLESPLNIGDRHISVGASIGLARSTADIRLSSSEMLRRGDVAMYMSKRGGRMRCTWFTEAFDQRREAVREIEDELREALANQELDLAYQPLVDAQVGKIVAVEALLRWTRPNGEAVSPSVFIPVAEESGLINPIGLWVLRKALCDAGSWGDIKLSVNISAAQLRNPEFPIKLGELLEETGFPPERLELEITETCLVLDPVVAERTLEVIRGFGVNISLDDFGTGYASIGFLRQFRFEKLKLDRSLVVHAGEDDGSRAMMLSSIAMARAMKMSVTAEGVETAEQADMVRVAGADQLQGWLYYKAMPGYEIDRLYTAQVKDEITGLAGGKAA